ncbi:hypothetical protein [Brucella sp. IR073]|uniref:hypothetical protein n=1 Tax=unclassified Brucella TaxID=2632610 RepID=UPI003B97E14F
MITKEYFTQEAAFAKVVETTGGPALLIGGYVIHVTAPGFDGADYLSSALRRLAQDGPNLLCSAAKPGQPQNEIPLTLSVTDLLRRSADGARA